MSEKKATVKLWFRFLKAAQRKQLPIDGIHYRDWGTLDDIKHLTFDAWWKSTGTKLFPREPELTVSNDGDVVVLSIPKRFTAEEVRKAMKLVTPYLDRTRRKSAGKWVPDGVVRYEEFAIYLRLLEIQLASAHLNKPMKQKLALLEQEYARIRSKTEKRNETMAANKGKSKGFKKIGLPPVLKDTSDATGYRWLKKGNAIATDVANGRFPGRGYRKQ